MSSYETYVRVRLKKKEDAPAYQVKVAARPGYIGSYEVEAQSTTANEQGEFAPKFQFHVVVGYRLPAGEQESPDDVVGALLADLRTDPEVDKIRTLRNRKPVEDDQETQGG